MNFDNLMSMYNYQLESLKYAQLSLISIENSIEEFVESYIREEARQRNLFIEEFNMHDTNVNEKVNNKYLRIDLPISEKGLKKRIRHELNTLRKKMIPTLAISGRDYINAKQKNLLTFDMGSFGYISTKNYYDKVKWW